MAFNIACFLAVPMIAAAVATSPEMDMDYSGDVDIYTGQPLEKENKNGETGANLVNLADGGYYNRTEHTFVYAPDGMKEGVHSSVANGMTVTDPVSLTIDEGLTASLYCNGTIVKKKDMTSIETPGKYSVVAKSGDNESQILNFVIVKPVTGAIDSYQIPTGFNVTSVTLDGEDTKQKNASVVDLSEDGDYIVTYRCQAIGIDYELKITTDHVPPKITLQGVKDGGARGPVTIKGVKDGETMEVKRDGEKVNMLGDNVVKNTGAYEVRVTDQAGNVTKKKFIIHMYLNYQSVIFFLLGIVVLIAAGVYMFISRKKLRVR